MRIKDRRYTEMGTNRGSAAWRDAVGAGYVTGISEAMAAQLLAASSAGYGLRGRSAR